MYVSTLTLCQRSKVRVEHLQVPLQQLPGLILDMKASIVCSSDVRGDNSGVF